MLKMIKGMCRLPCENGLASNSMCLENQNYIHSGANYLKLERFMMANKILFTTQNNSMFRSLIWNNLKTR